MLLLRICKPLDNIIGGNNTQFTRLYSNRQYLVCYSPGRYVSGHD